MIGPFGDDAHVQLIAVDHQGLFETILYAYRMVASKGADRAILHRAALATDYKADPDEVNRLRDQQRRLAELDAPDRDALIDQIERAIEREHGDDRSASTLSRMDLADVRDAAIRWCVIGKRGAPVRAGAELLGLLDALFGEEGPALLEGTEDPVDHVGVPVFPPTDDGRRPYRPPEAVAAACALLEGVDRPTLDRAVDGVVGTGPSAEEVATWLEEDYEALTSLHRRAAARRAGLWYRVS